MEITPLFSQIRYSGQYTNPKLVGSVYAKTTDVEIIYRRRVYISSHQCVRKKSIDQCHTSFRVIFVQLYVIALYYRKGWPTCRLGNGAEGGRVRFWPLSVQRSAKLITIIIFQYIIKKVLLWFCVSVVFHIEKEEPTSVNVACHPPRMHANERLDGNEICPWYVFSPLLHTCTFPTS